MRIETTYDERLREYPRDPEELVKAIDRQRRDLDSLREALEESPNELDRSRLGRVLNRLSDYLRLAGDYEQALEYADEACGIWREFGRDKATFLADLRRVELRAATSGAEAALPDIDELCARTDSEPFDVYRDFALQLRGRIQYAAGNIQRARADLEAALEHRREMNRGRLAEQTEQLLALVDQAM